MNLLLAAMIVYIPYQSHYAMQLPIKGMNLMNVLFVVALLAIALRRERTATPAPLKGRFLIVMCALCWAFAIGQYYDGSTLPDDLTELKTAVFYILLYFLFYHAVRDVKAIRFLLVAILLVTFLVSLQAVRQGLDYGVASFSESKRASGPFGRDYMSANLAAAYFVIFLPLYWAVALSWKSRPMLRWISLGALALGVFGVFFTFSRQAYFILPGLLLFQSVRRNVLLAVLVLAAVASYEAWVPASVVERIDVTEQTDEHGQQKLDDSTEARFILWDGAGNLIKDRPWGIGLNHFKREIGKYVPPEWSNFDAHNGYVLVATEAGIPAAIALCVLLVSLLRLGWRVERLDDSEDSRVLGGALVVGAAGVILSNLFGSRVFQGEVMGNFWILAGLVARYYTLALEQRASASTQRPASAIAAPTSPLHGGSPPCAASPAS